MSNKANYEELIDDIMKEVEALPLSHDPQGQNYVVFEVWLKQRIEKFVAPPDNGLDIHEFRQLGLLQEVNRRFFHPIGLALAVNSNKDGEPRIIDSLAYIIDSRDDPEGFCFAGIPVGDARQRAAYYKSEVAKRLVARHKLFQANGPFSYFDGIQPIKTMNMEIPSDKTSD